MSKETVVSQLVGLGWSKEQAIGVAANIQQESNFNPNAVGDGGRAYGIAQWHPDRQAAFQEYAGKPIKGSTIQEQIGFIDYELRRGREQGAGKRLAAATSATEAAGIVSQFYERPADTHVEIQRRSKLAAQMAGTPWSDETVPAVAPARPQIDPGASDGWPRLPTYRAGAASDSRASDEAVLSANTNQLAANIGSPDASWAAQDRQYNALVADQAARDQVGVGDVFTASRHDPRDQALFTVLDRLSGERETPPEGWSYQDNKDAIEEGLSDDEREYARENVHGPESMAQVRGQIEYRRGLDKTYDMAGGWANFLGRMGGGLMDPVGFAAGVGAGKVLQLAGLGSRAAIAAGRPGLAATSLVAEGALGNVALEGVQDAMGEVKTTSDYAMAAAMGAIFTAPFARGAYSQAADEAVLRMATDMRARAAEEQANKLLKLRDETGETDPRVLARTVEANEKSDIETAVREATTVEPARDQVVPADVADAIRRDAEEPQTPPVVDPEPVPPKSTTTEEATPEQTALHDEQVKAYEDEMARRKQAAELNKQIEKPELRKEPAPKVEPRRPDQLPQHLSKATPRYGNRELIFGSDLDRAAYIVAGKGESKAHAEYLDFLMANGYDPDHAIALGKDLRAHIKKTLRGAPDGPVQVPANMRPIKASTEGLEFPKLDLDIEREIPAAEPGKPPIKLRWALQDSPRDGTFTAGEILDGILRDKVRATKEVRALAKYLKDAISDRVKDVRVLLGPDIKRGMFYGKTGDITSPSKAAKEASLQAHLDSMDNWHYETVLHEMVHAATHSKIEAAKTNIGDLSPEARAAVRDLALLRQRLSDIARRQFPTERDMATWVPTVGPERLEYVVKYALQDLHELSAVSMSDELFRTWLRRQDGLPVAGKPTSAWSTFITQIAKLLDFVKPGKNDSLTQATSIIDRLISADGSNIRYQGGELALAAPAINTGVGQRRYAARMLQHAQQWLAANPIDMAKLRVITAKLPGGASDGIVLASSKNPILQMIAGLVTETTTGAAGRKANVAIRTATLHRKLIGDAMLGYQNSFNTWGKTNGATLWDSVMHGNKRREFDRAVYEEILDRRSAGYRPSADASVREAADHLEALHERSRVAQVEAGTLGSGNLPGNSRGYTTQALDGAKLQTLTVQELAAFHDELSAQFQQRLGWDKAFADTFAPYYTDRIRKRAQGSKDVDAIGGGGNAIDTVRDTLDEMAFDPATRDKMTAANLARAGIGTTKRRLDLDLRREFAPGKKLLDVYVTDPLLLSRMYARRVAGNVALTEQGILGIRGVRELREAAATPVDGMTPTREELESYDRVMSEILGTPVAGQVASAGATNLALIVQLQRLGGLVFTQAAEQYNMLHHLGLRSLLAGVGALPRMLGEVGRLKKGAPSGNSILTSIEAYGGEIGTESYKMVAPLDPPEARIEDYVKQSGLMTRLLRAGGHAQSKISFFRGLMSAQHRATAEQIVMRAARMIRDGGDEIALRDMGFTPDVANSLRGDLANVAQWDSSGRLVAFDLTQVSDPRTAEAFVQAVHRGTSQIIQGTFIGERSKWLHNDYLRLMLQLRTFGITATEKQLQRTAMLHGGGFQGYAYAGGYLLGQMALAMPIHAARVHAAGVGREDREKFLKDNLNPAALVRASMNYSSLSGSTGDILELTAAIAGGWGDAETKEMLGARQQAVGVGRLIPVAGSIDNAFKVVSGKSDIHTAIRQLPFSNLPYVAPFVSLTKTD